MLRYLLVLWFLTWFDLFASVEATNKVCPIFSFFHQPWFLKIKIIEVTKELRSLRVQFKVLAAFYCNGVIHVMFYNFKFKILSVFFLISHCLCDSYNIEFCCHSAVYMAFVTLKFDDIIIILWYYYVVLWQLLYS